MSEKEKKEKYPVPTGNPWLPNNNDPATVALPTPVILSNVEGPFTERDRKLWVFLFHAVWDEIPDDENDVENIKIHELPVAEIARVFRELGADHNTAWIWGSVQRMAKTIVEWEDEEYQGIDNLLGSAITKSGRDNGRLRFYFPPLLAPKIKKARRYARLRTHFMISLSGKYAVTLYEMLESVANKVHPVLEAEITQLRLWLKVPDGKMPRFANFKQRVLEPSIKQINDDPLSAGFTVEVEYLQKGRAVERVRFTVHKVNERKLAEAALKQGRSLTQALTVDEGDGLLFDQNPSLKTATIEGAKKLAPGWDIYALQDMWLEKIKRDGMPNKPDSAFLGYVKGYFKRHGRPPTR